jgi:hypothetical protein
VITYERVTYRPEGAKRSRTIYLRNPREITLMGHAALTGVRVNRETEEVAARGVDEEIHVITADLITKRTPVRVNLKYGTLEAA